MTPAEEKKTKCRGCRALMPSSARFCPKCGSPTLAHRRALQKEYRKEGSSERRAAAAIACLFFGGVAALLLPGQDETFVNWSHDLGTIVVGFLAMLLLGKESFGSCFAGRASIKQLAGGALIGVIAFGASTVYVSLLQVFADSEFSIELGWLAFISLVVLAPLLEEWTFRGVAWTAAERIGGPGFTILLTAVLFAMAHGLNGGFVIEFPHRFVGGLLFGWLRLKTGSLWPGIIAHGTLNMIAFFEMGGFS